MRTLMLAVILSLSMTLFPAPARAESVDIPVQVVSAVVRMSTIEFVGQPVVTWSLVLTVIAPDGSTHEVAIPIKVVLPGQ